MGLSCLIVDDEQLSRKYVRNLVQEFVPLSNIQEANSAKVAIPIIESGDLDAVFLDIKMSKVDGFELLNSLSHRNFELVFITAYNQYAIKAIKAGAFDYLLKPIRKNDFKDTVNRLLKKRNEKPAVISKPIDKPDDYLNQKLTLHHNKGITFVALKDILYLKADNTYTTIHLINNTNITVSKPIIRFESALDPRWFFRVHKSYILNTFHLKEYISTEGGIAHLNNGEKIYISRYRLGEFLNLIRHQQGGLTI